MTDHPHDDLDKAILEAVPDVGCYWWDGQQHDEHHVECVESRARVRLLISEKIADAIADGHEHGYERGRREALEEACRALCDYCNEGLSATCTGTLYQHVGNTGSKYWCMAGTIRALMAPAQGEEGE